MKKRIVIPVLVVIAIGLAGGLFYFLPDSAPGKPADGQDKRQVAAHAESPEAEPENPKGPHGGRLLSKGAFSVEVTIYEQGVPPEFRIYAFENGKPVDPAQIRLKVELGRLGVQPEQIGFLAKKDYLVGDREIAEPHSFTVRVVAQYKDQEHNWAYEQIEGRINMDDAVAGEAGIGIAAAGPAKIRSLLQLSGEIQFNQDRLAHVVPRLDGVVLRSVKNLGDPVRRGELLAVVESQMLADLKSEHLATQTRLNLATATFEREKRLWEEKISAEQDYLASRQALAEAGIADRNAEQKLLALGLDHAAIARGGDDALTRYEIRSPIDGVVIEKHLSLGEAIKEDASIFTIADLSTVWAEMTIYPKDLASVKIGQKVTVNAVGLNIAATGSVSYVGSLIGEQTRSAKARVTLQNPARSWRPGLFVTVELVESEVTVPVAVSIDAIQTYRDWKVVFARFDGQFEARPVELGRSDGKLVEIVEGLQSGTKYAAANSFVLKAELGKAGASHDH